jgi:cytochrome bd-type quinol oxidase subunit 2
MAQTNRRKKNSFRKFEGMLTKVILGELAGFLLMLLFAALGVGWLKWILAVAVILVSGAGCALLVSKQEHKKRRSWWMLASFAGMLLCTLVSLIAGYPAPGI